MNYKRIYNNIIDKRNEELLDRGMCYCELHHIIPKSLGGTNIKENLVYVTTREHFICHLLLSKIYTYQSNEWYKMNHAFLMMSTNPTNGRTRYINSRLYEYRKQYASMIMQQCQSGTKNSNYGRKWISHVDMKLTKPVSVAELDDYIGNGWILGRNKWNTTWEYKHKIKRIQHKESKRKTRKELASILYNEYITGEYKSLRDFATKSEYNKSHVALYKLWKEHLTKDEYNRILNKNT